MYIYYTHTHAYHCISTLIFTRIPVCTHSGGFLYHKIFAYQSLGLQCFKYLHACWRHIRAMSVPTVPMTGIL